MISRSLTFAQKQKITNSLFWTVAIGAVFTVALPSLLPCPAMDKSRKAGTVYAEGDEREGSNTKEDNVRRKVIITSRQERTST